MRISFPLIFLSFSYIALADWQMFADKDNTYLYNTLTGEVYIKHSMGGENYEDVFVKMPKGISSPMSLPSKKNANKQNDLEAVIKLANCKSYDNLLLLLMDIGTIAGKSNEMFRVIEGLDAVCNKGNN